MPLIRLWRAFARVVAGSVASVALLFGVLVAVVRQPCCNSTPLQEGPRADPSRLAAHVAFLTGSACPRSPRYPLGLDVAGAYVAVEMTRAGAQVTEQPYLAGSTTCRNVIGTLGPGNGPVVVVAAHLDASGDVPGADDNASGVAGLLELGRLLGARALPGPVLLVACSTEEPPHFGGPEMGSAVHARSLRLAGTPVAAMLALEMIGYFTAEQPRHAWLLDLAYPRRGDFVCVVGRWSDRIVARTVKRAFRGSTAVPAVSWSGPTSFGGDLSDHRSYWAEGFAAVMVTDTAYLRNPNYHAATDTADTLDYVRMGGVVDGVAAAVVALASEAVRHQASRR